MSTTRTKSTNHSTNDSDTYSNGLELPPGFELGTKPNESVTIDLEAGQRSTKRGRPQHSDTYSNGLGLPPGFELGTKPNESITIDLEAGLRSTKRQRPQHVVAASHGTQPSISSQPRRVIKARHGTQSSISSQRSTTSTIVEDTKRNLKNLLFLIPPAGFFGVHMYFAVDFMIDSGDSACLNDGTYTFSLGMYCLVASLMSLGLTVILAFAWWNHQQKDYVDRKQKKSKRKESNNESACQGSCRGAVCFTVWNIVWAAIGIWMYLTEFDHDCRSEPMAVLILVWAAFQFSWLCLSLSIMGFLVYMAFSEGVPDLVDAATEQA